MEKPAKRFAVLFACLSLTVIAWGDGAIAKQAAASQQTSLHRLDFRVEGASCVTCLRRIGQTFRDTKGVIKADVSIYRPYWAIVIYDAKRTNINQLSDAIKTEHVKFVEVQDKPISDVPPVIVPKAMGG